MASHGVQAAIQTAVAKVLKERPADPMAMIAQQLLDNKLNDSPLRDEEARKDEKPVTSSRRAVELAHELFGLVVDEDSLKELDSYDDRNFYFRASHTRPALAQASDANAASTRSYHFVLKIHNGVESLDPSFVECQNLAMDKVRAVGVWCPRALPALDGGTIAFATSKLANGTPRNHAVRCLPFRPAKLLGQVVLSLELMREFGTVAARVSAALVSFDHPAAHRSFVWDLAQTLAIRPLVMHLDTERQQTIYDVMAEFETFVLPRAAQLRKAVIHGDLNDQNVLIRDGCGAGEGSSIVGVIDFGDMCHTWLINDIAISTAYALIALHYDHGPSEAPSAASQDTQPSEVATAAAIVSAYAAEMARQEMVRAASRVA